MRNFGFNNLVLNLCKFWLRDSKFYYYYMRLCYKINFTKLLISGVHIYHIVNALFDIPRELISTNYQSFAYDANILLLLLIILRIQYFSNIYVIYICCIIEIVILYMAIYDFIYSNIMIRTTYVFFNITVSIMVNNFNIILQIFDIL